MSTAEYAASRVESMRDDALSDLKHLSDLNAHVVACIVSTRNEAVRKVLCGDEMDAMNTIGDSLCVLPLDHTDQDFLRAAKGAVDDLLYIYTRVQRLVAQQPLGEEVAGLIRRTRIMDTHLNILEEAMRQQMLKREGYEQ